MAPWETVQTLRSVVYKSVTTDRRWTPPKPQPCGRRTLAARLTRSQAPSLRCLRRLRRPHGCPFESHPATALTPPQPRRRPPAGPLGGGSPTPSRRRFAALRAAHRGAGREQSSR